MPAVKPSSKLTLHDRLSRLSFDQACKLLGDEGKKLIIHGSKREIDLHEDVYLGGDLLRVTLREPSGKVEAVATLTMMAEHKDRLHWSCDRCFRACEHVGAMFSLLLENKVGLGLAAAPPDREPAAELTEEQLVHRALADREERAAHRAHEGAIRQFGDAVDRLHRDQPRQRQDVSRVAARAGGGAIVLLVPRLPHQHARHLQTRDEGRQHRPSQVHPRAAQEALSPAPHRGPAPLRPRHHPGIGGSRPAARGRRCAHRRAPWPADRQCRKPAADARQAGSAGPRVPRFS